MGSGNELVMEELEALKYVFNDDEMKIMERDPVEIAVQIDPEASSSGLQFVHACLVLRTSPAYPEAAVQCSLVDVKGLGDKRREELLTVLAREAQDMAGEMSLGHLCNLAKDVVSELNQPEDTCAFCLEEMEDSCSPDEGLIVLACYHCFHRSCFARWYSAAQKAKKTERERVIQDYKHAATAEFLAKTGLEIFQHGLFAIPCPVCRTIIDPQRFKMADLLQFKSAKDANPSTKEQGLGLDGAALDTLRQMQSRHRSLYAQQLARDGIVSEKYAVQLN